MRLSFIIFLMKFKGSIDLTDRIFERLHNLIHLTKFSITSCLDRGINLTEDAPTLLFHNSN